MLLLPNKPQKEIGGLWDTRQDGGEKRDTGEENTQEKEGTFLFCFVFKYTKYLMKSENRRKGRNYSDRCRFKDVFKSWHMMGHLGDSVG